MHFPHSFSCGTSGSHTSPSVSTSVSPALAVIPVSPVDTVPSVSPAVLSVASVSVALAAVLSVALAAVLSVALAAVLSVTVIDAPVDCEPPLAVATGITVRGPVAAASRRALGRGGRHRRRHRRRPGRGIGPALAVPGAVQPDLVTVTSADDHQCCQCRKEPTAK